MAPASKTETTSAAERVFARFPGHEKDASRQDDLWRALVEEVLSPAVAFETHLSLYRRVFAGRAHGAPPPAVWRPTASSAAATNLGRWMAARGVTDYAVLQAWSAADRAGFWGEVAKRLGIRFDRAPTMVLDPASGVEDPRWFPGAAMNIVASCFQADEDAVAIVQRREGDDTLQRVTYGALKDLVDRVAGGLRREGFRPGDAIALYMPMTVECVAAYLGIIQAGCVAVSVADSFAPKEVRMRLRLADAKAVVTVDAFARGGKTFPLFAKAVEAGAARAIVVSGSADVDGLRDVDIRWTDLVAGPPDAKPDVGAPERATNILFSSGTTGEPKAIPWTHLTPIKCAMDGHFHHDIRPGDVVAWPTNIGWMMGPWLIYAALINKGTMALYEGAPTTAAFCRFVQDAGVTMLGLVPALVRAWRANGATDGVDWRHLRLFSSTGEASNVDDYLWLMSRAAYAAPVVEYCGGTEIGGGHITGTLVQPASPATFTTPALGLDFVVLREDGTPVAPGETGTLYVVPPSIGLSQRLLNRDHHEEYFADCPPGPDGLVLRRHGDAVHRLAGGTWRAQGRADDTMNLGGIKVSSLELERVADEDPLVYQSAAVAIQPADGGADLLVLFVVPRAAGTGPDALRPVLQKRIGSELNPLFRIHDVVVVASLPRTASNKIMRRELRAAYRSAGDDSKAPPKRV